MTSLLQQLLTDAARRSPRGVALVAEDQTLTYGDLDRLSTQLAHALQEQGVQRGDRVGILAPKSAAAVIAVFASLKTGACYVPLDPGSPDERLELIIGDSGIAVLLADAATSSRAAQLVADQPEGGVVTLGPLGPRHTSGGAADRSRGPDLAASGAVGWDTVLAQPTAALAPTGAVDTDLAYILYTSGSTGVPKGVMISHRASLTFVQWAASCARLTESDRICSPAPLHFDLSVFDIFASCQAGASMVVAPALTAMFPARLASWIEEQRITVWYSVPSVLTLLVTHGNLGGFDLSRLRTVIFAGEVFPARHLSLLMRQLPHARYLNWYGPTETNVCTWYEVPSDTAPPTAPVPIGTACTAVDVFAVTDGGDRVSEPGQKGELYVGGPGLMSGYWAQPEKTLDVLVPNPLGNDDDAPVYRSGDIVTVDEQGSFVFLGRRDGMVKTRGYRVELGEVETALYEHPAVAEAVVLPVADELLGNRLRAVIRAEDGLSREDLLEHCRRLLPAYMVPDVIEFADTLPKTSTGKIDRLSLQGG